MSPPALSVGQKIELNDGRVGFVRFIGNTTFQTGEWIGVELDDASGKNDGSVLNRRYFDCAPEHGIFCRATGVSQVLEDPKPKTAKPTSNGAAIKGRPSSIIGPSNGARRQTLQPDGPGRRASAIQSTPTPKERTVSGVRSPVKSPSKQLASNGHPSTATSRTNTPPAGAVAKRSSIASKPARSSLAPPSTTTAGRRTSTLPSAQGLGTRPGARQPPPNTTTTGRGPASARPAPGTAASTRTTTQPRPSNGKRLAAAKEESTGDEASDRSNVLSPRESTASEAPSQDETEEEQDDTIRNFAPPLVPPIPTSPGRSFRQRRPSSPTAASVHSQRTIRSSAQSARQIEELEAKIRVLERKRGEDRELRQSLEKAEQERDQYKGIIEKLQNKYRPQQQELDRLRQELAGYQAQFSGVEDLKSRHEVELEAAWVDREYAEEQADAYKAELDSLRHRTEEMELELEILKEENGELSKEMSPEERTSAGWLHLKNSNERLKEALISLRDITQDKEADLKQQIDALDDQVQGMEGMKSNLEATREQLLRSQADTEDLRQQLEVALGAEDMIERLTDDNDSLRNKISDLRAAIDDLEALRELNDELEINHIEAEKQLQEEMDFKESLLLDREKTAREQQAALDEAEYNITRFRELVTQLQSDLQDLQSSKQISESEAAELSNKSRAMIDLNQRLQKSAAKTQVKTIDLELRKLDAQQASENLEIVQLFLPETFQAERDSVLALLRFRRIAFKANLVQNFVRDRVSSFDPRGNDEEVFAACEALDKLTWVSSMANRLVNSISSCTPETFAQYSSAYFELEVVERTLNDYVEALRRDDLMGSDLAVRLGRSVDVMEHLSSLYLHNGLPDHADDLLMRALMLQSRMDTAATALSLSKIMVETHLQTDDEDEEAEDENVSDTALILNRIKAIADLARNAKLVSAKTLRALTDLQERSLTLDVSFTEQFKDAEAVASEITTYACETGSNLQQIFGEEGRNEPFAPSDVADVLSRAATKIFSLGASESGPYTTLASRLRDLSGLLVELSAIPTDLDNTVEFERAAAPWNARAQELKQTKITSIDIETELARSLENVRERDNLIRQKETELEEQSVRIEMLEARMKDASKRSAKIAELERGMREAKDNEAKARMDLARARQDAQHDIERVREEMARLADDRTSNGDSKNVDSNAMGVGIRVTLKRQEHKIAGLQGAVRYLNEDNRRLRLPPPNAPQAIKAGFDWLDAPLLVSKKSLRKPSAAVHREGEKLLEQMLVLASQPPSVDLTKIPENKLAWRPHKEHSRWNVEVKNEEWASWKQWRSVVLKTGSL